MDNFHNNFVILQPEKLHKNNDMATDKVTYWIDIADEDLGVARTCTKQSDGSTLHSCAIKQ